MFNRKSKKRIISLLAAMMMIFTMVPGMAFAETTCDRIELTTEKMHLECGESGTIEFVLEEGHSREEIVWSSENPDIASVEDGNVIGKSKGIVKVCATIEEKTVKCTVTVLTDGVYGGPKRRADANTLTQLYGQDNPFVMDGPEDESEYLYVFTDGKKHQSATYSTVMRIDNTSVIQAGTGTSFKRIANGKANIYVYEKDNFTGEHTLLYIVPVVVSNVTDENGEPLNAPNPEDQRETQEGPQIAGGAVELKGYTINTSTVNDVIFDNYIMGDVSIRPEFKFTFTSSGKGTAPENLQELYDACKTEYLAALKPHIQLTDADGNIVETSITFDRFYNEKAYYLDLTVAADLDYNQAYKLVLTHGTPTLTCNYVGTALEWGAAEAIAKAVEYSFFTEKGDITDATVDAIEDQTYTGEAITPAVVVKDGETVLVEDVDYTVTYADNTEVGTATVTITGKGNYEGTQEVTFEIAPKAIDAAGIEIDITDKTYTGEAFVPEVVVKDGETVLVEDVDYTVTYADNTEVGTATVTITGKGNYEGTQEVTFEIAPKAIDAAGIEIDITDKTYTGEAFVPEVVVKDGETVLVEDVDYTVTYADNTEVGTATVTITGIGNYTGTHDVTFNIVAAPVEDPTQPEDDVTQEDEPAAEEDDEAAVEEEDSSAQTGDESNMLPFFALMMAALAAAGAAVIRRREN